MSLGFGLIGSGFMGKAHTLGFLNVNRVFRLPVEVALRKLADVDAATAERGAKDLGFPSFTGDWRELVSDPSIDIVSVATPNATHREMSLAAIAHGKHVYCEKPLAPTAAEAGEMALAAEKADVKSMVGFNYSRNPLFGLAKDIIASGEIGDVRMIRAIHAEDHMMDADAPWTWRIDPAGGGGALIDIGSHILATTLYLLGPIIRVLGDVATLIQTRPVARGAKERRKVEVDDVGRAFVRFASGVQGVIEATYVSTGRKMQHEFEISGSKGAISFSQERFNEIDLFVASDASGGGVFARYSRDRSTSLTAISASSPDISSASTISRSSRFAICCSPSPRMRRSSGISATVGRCKRRSRRSTAHPPSGAGSTSIDVSSGRRKAHPARLRPSGILGRAMRFKGKVALDIGRGNRDWSRGRSPFRLRWRPCRSDRAAAVAFGGRRAENGRGYRRRRRGGGRRRPPRRGGRRRAVRRIGRRGRQRCRLFQRRRLGRGRFGLAGKRQAQHRFDLRLHTRVASGASETKRQHRRHLLDRGAGCRA